MKKTSIYLDDEQVRDLQRASEVSGRSQAELIREAIVTQTSKILKPTRNFSMYRSGRGPGGSIAELDEKELLKGFGE